MKQSLQKRTKTQRILGIAGIIVSTAVIILCGLSIFNIWEGADNFVLPLMGVMLLLQAIREWKTQRFVAIFSLAVAVFIVILTVFKLFL